MKTLPLLAIAVLVTLSLNTPTHAQFFRSWIDSNGGSYGDLFNWNPAGVPNINDGAGFGLNATYIVTLPTDQTTGVVTVSNGFVSFFLGSSGTPRTLTVPGTVTVTGAGILSVRDGAVDPGNIMVANGGQLDVMSTATIIVSDGSATVTGNGSTWTQDNPIIVGDIGAGVLSIEAGALVSSDLPVEGPFSGVIAAGGGSTGDAAVTGNGSTWTNFGGLSIGDLGQGTLTISDGGTVSNQLDGSIATLPGSLGEVTVDGSGSTWTSSGANFNVGDQGAGTLNITGGGVVSTGTANISRTSGSVSSATVDGTGSLWSISDSFAVGTRGHGTLNITEGGVVENTDGFVGSLAGAQGTVTVSGEGSTWTSSGEFRVGNFGTGELTIEAGGTVFSTPSRIGVESDSTGEVTITGEGSSWSSGTLLVGLSGDGTLAIEDGGHASSFNADVAFDTDSMGTSTVAGLGSTWIISNKLNVGRNSSGALTISDGGAVDSNVGIVGDNPGSLGEVTVSGVGSTWRNRDSLSVGRRGNGTLTIADGGSVEGLFFVNIGGFNPPSGAVGTVTVTGIGSTLTISDALNIGFVQEGTLSISNGGSVESMFGLIGRNSNATGTAIVSGVGSTWTTSNVLIVGDRGDGTLTIQDGGRVENTLGIIGRGSNGNGTVNVAGTDSIWTMSERLSIGGDTSTDSNGGTAALTIDPGGTVDVAQDVVLYPDGTLRLGGGTLSTTGISFEAGGQFEWTSGTLQVEVFDGDLTNPSGGTLAPGNSAGGTTIFGDYSQQIGASMEIEIGGTATATQFDFVDVNGSALLGGSLELALIDGFQPGPADDFVVFNSDDLSGFFGNAGNGQRVDTTDGLGSFVVHYGPTSMFNSNQIVLTNFLPSLTADFDNDGDVDGRDFLFWQRGGSSNPLSSSDLALWQAQYGNGVPTVVTAQTVPEPNALVALAFWAMLTCCGTRQSRPR